MSIKRSITVDITSNKGAFVSKIVSIHNLIVELQETSDELLSAEQEETQNICSNLLGEACNNLRIVMTIANDPSSVDSIFEKGEQS